MNFLTDFIAVFYGLYKDRGMLWRLSKNDIKARFSSSLLGVIWAYIQPLSTILVFWFVFQVGLRNADIGNYPFIIWFVPAYLSWTFFQDTLSSMTGSIREYSYLVRKVNFNVSLIPYVKLISGCFVHMAFIAFIFAINAVYGNTFQMKNLQVFYYFICTVVLLSGLGVLCATITPFVGDVPNIVSVLLQIVFWATPIVWNANGLSPKVLNILKMNPMYYICMGYRDSFIGDSYFWESSQTLWFWIFAIIILCYGVHLFRRMQKDFADVL